MLALAADEWGEFFRGSLRRPSSQPAAIGLHAFMAQPCPVLIPAGSRGDHGAHAAFEAAAMHVEIPRRFGAVSGEVCGGEDTRERKQQTPRKPRREEGRVMWSGGLSISPTLWGFLSPS